MTDDKMALLPCPFCGSEWVDINKPANPRVPLSVKCHACNSHGTANSFEEAEAISAWNTRAALTPAPLPDDVAGRTQTHSEGCWQWHHECAKVRVATLASRLAVVEAERDAAYKEACSLAEVMCRRWFWPIGDWKPLEDTAGVISQIDNMIAGICSRLRETLRRATTAEARAEAAERALMAHNCGTSGCLCRELLDNRDRREASHD